METQTTTQPIDALIGRMDQIAEAREARKRWHRMARECRAAMIQYREIVAALERR